MQSSQQDFYRRDITPQGGRQQGSQQGSKQQGSNQGSKGVPSSNQVSPMNRTYPPRSSSKDQLEMSQTPHTGSGAAGIRITSKQTTRKLDETQ